MKGRVSERTSSTLCSHLATKTTTFPLTFLLASRSNAPKTPSRSKPQTESTEGLRPSFAG